MKKKMKKKMKKYMLLYRVPQLQREPHTKNGPSGLIKLERVWLTSAHTLMTDSFSIVMDQRMTPQRISMAIALFKPII